MTPKALKWWEGEFDKACALASYLCCNLTLDQFCACRGIEDEEDRQLLFAHLHKQRSIGL